MIIPSFFGAFASQPALQALIDDTLDTLQAQSLWRSFLDEGTPQASLTFEQVIGRSRINAAASIVDIDAPHPLRSNNKLETYTGKIPSMKQAFTLDQSEIRELKALEESQLLNSNGAVTALIKKLYDHVSLASVAGDKRVDILLLQAISTLTVDTTTTLNPDGAAYGVIDLLPKAYQKQGVPIVWSDLANSTPIDDIQNYVDFITTTFGRSFSRILMSKPMWLKFKKSAQVIDRLKSFFNIGKSNGTYAVTLSNVNEMFTENLWPNIEIINDVVGIESDGVINPIRAFNDNNLSFLPSGNIGILKNAWPIEMLMPIPNKTYAFFGPTMVSKWLDDSPFREFTAMDMNAFPALNTDSIFILKTDTVQASFTGTTGS